MKNTLACALMMVAVFTLPAQAGSVAVNDEIIAFNQAFAVATRTMNSQATLALWEDDGAALLPDAAPILGKPAMDRFLVKVIKQLHGAHMQKFELVCHDVQITGNWASEWCDEHQRVVFANGLPPLDGKGRMLLVLHREPDKTWHLSREMWQAVKIP